MRVLTSLVCLVVLVLGCSCSHVLWWRHHEAKPAAPAKATPIGHTWSGQGRVTVSWLNADHLPVVITLGDRGVATGTIGDATLVQGRWHAVTGWYSGARTGRDVYEVEGLLQGPVVAADNLTRASVKVRLEFTGTLLLGELQTNGVDNGTKTDAPLAVIGLRLRAPDLVAPAAVVPASKAVVPSSTSTAPAKK